MTTKRFEPLDISGDAGIRAFGPDLKELFVNSALGMYSLITDPDEITGSDTLDVSCENVTVEGLLVSWLNELIFRFDAYGFLAKEIVITDFAIRPERPGEVSAPKIKASLTGEAFEPERHAAGLLIKAATYHKLKIEKVGDLWVAEIIFDI